MKRSLIIGGTKGLGRAIAKRSLASREQVIVCARDVGDAPMDQDLYGAALCGLDVSRPLGIERLFKRPVSWQDVTNVYWTAGHFLEGKATDTDDYLVRKLTQVHLTGFISNLTAFHRMMKMVRPLDDNPGQPYHLVVTSSTSSWRVRENEAAYGAVCAGKSQYVRNFSQQLVRELPGSKVTLVHPGGMKNPNFYDGTDRDITSFMESDAVAAIIHARVTAQSTPYDEYAILRNVDGSPRVENGVHAPEMPF